MKKVAFLLVDNYRDEEFIEPYELLINNGVEVKVFGVKHSGKISGAGGTDHEATGTLDDLEREAGSFDMLVIPGGPGSKEELWNNEKVLSLIKHFHSAGKPVAAICYGVIPLVQAGILKGKSATVYPSEEAKKILEDGGVQFSESGVVVLESEKIITAQGPSFAKEFADAVYAMLTVDERVE